MKFRLILPLLLLAMQSAICGQDVTTLRRQGDDALAAGLWEMAALHFNQCLTNNTLAAADQSQVAIRLAEALVRDGKHAEALSLLDQSLVATNPATPFWKGQALAGLGRYTEACKEFAGLLDKPTAPHRNEASFTLASLQLALEQPAAALATLATLTRTPDAALNAKARLRQVEILLDLGRPADARANMPAVSSLGARERPLATFLEAHLLLTEGHPDDAATNFQALLDQPQGQSLHHYHMAACGLATALHRRGPPEAATNFLLTFIPNHPDSPLLEELFQLLIDGVPDNPAPTDPILERLAQWITPSELSATGAINTLDSNAATAWPTTTTTNTNDLLAFAIFSRALGLHRINSPSTRSETRRLITRLRLEYPNHTLTSRALFQMARWELADGNIEQACYLLDTLRAAAKSPLTQGEAAFLEAHSAYANGDHNQAIELFNAAAKSLSQRNAQIARLNAAIISLHGTTGSTTLVRQADQPLDPALAADLELERALSNNNPAAVLTALTTFLTNNPQHPRAPEARLAAAEAALTGPTPDLAFARAQLAALPTTPEPPANLSASRLALVKLRIDDLAKDTTAAIATAKAILANHRGEPAAAEAALILGRNLFQSRNYNDARLVLEQLAATDQDPARAQAAGLLAARAAALVPTSQSQQEALILFDKVIATKGSLAAIASLEKARLMIDLNRLPEVIAFLRQWFDSLPPTDPLHLPAGLLLGEAIYAQGGANPNSLTDALGIYDQLLAHAGHDPAVFNRLQYLRGRSLEQIPDAQEPSRKRDKQAFIAYYSVLETTTNPAEWHYFELCGFRALALLEKAGRWPAAIACAKKIASFNGPRAAEAATRASQLQLKHMIWED